MNKIRQKLNSMNLILRSSKLFTHISRFKYFKYIKLKNNIIELIKNSNDCMTEHKNINHNDIIKSDNTFYIFLVDSKSNKLLNIIQSLNSYHVFCIYRSYLFFSNKLGNSNVSQISIKSLYDLNLGNTNKYILNVVRSKIDICNIKSIFILTIGIDDKIIGYYFSNNNKQKEIDNNLNNSITIGKFLIYAICNFMSTYFLYEIGKNKQSQEKIEYNINSLKRQLLISDLIIKKNKLAHE